MSWQTWLRLLSDTNCLQNKSASLRSTPPPPVAHSVLSGAVSPWTKRLNRGLTSLAILYARGEEWVLSTDPEMIPAKNTTDTHAQDFLANDQLLLPILKAFVQCTGSLHATPNAWCFQSVAPTNSSSVVPSTTSSTPPHNTRHASLSGRSCEL